MENFETTNYNSLSVRDLIKARDGFHPYLIDKKNVIATAIGRYLIRRSDIDEYGRFKKQEKRGKRTLANSVVTSFSWPCILVFVEKWEDESDLINNGSSDIIPKYVSIEDDSEGVIKVPVCIVEANKNPVTDQTIIFERLRFPDNLIGGGFPLIVNSQGIQHIASVGCVVSDGHSYYALTNKHVSGRNGTEVFSKFGDDTIRIGVSTGNSLGKLNFSDLYNGFKNKNTLVNCDAGLIEIDDLNRWKTDVVGIEAMGEVLDLNTNNLSLSLITEHDFDDRGNKIAKNGKVVGVGAVSGKMEGEIIALFYRYKSLGGTEYVSDFLISGRDGNQLNVHHGDSGTLWLMEQMTKDNKNELRPFALHWGQHELMDNGAKSGYSYSMATSLTNIFRELDIDIVRGWNVNSDYSWGKVGHYTVGTLAIESIKNQELKTFITNNLEKISFKRTDISKQLAKQKDFPRLSKDPDEGFCALADVPDIVWKQPNSDNAPWGRKGDENPNHYADVDAPTTDGKTLFDICRTKEELTTENWMNYYDNVDKDATGIKKSDPERYGLISFRVWQIYNYMVDALKEGSAEKFLFAAGVLTHYKGDACQPLHSSYMADGDPKDDTVIDYTAKKDSPVTSKHPHKAGDVYKKPYNPGSGVHVAYEDNMIDDNIAKILPKVADILKDKNHAVNKEHIDNVDSGQAAGFLTLTLMQKTQETLKPSDIVEFYKANKDGGNISTALYKEFGKETIICLARGCRYLAAIWEAAWEQGGGSNNIALDEVADKALSDLYRDPAELPSMHLTTVSGVLDTLVATEVARN